MHPQDTPVQLPLFPEKRCSGPCGRLLPTEAFSRHKKARDGLNWRCKACDRDQARAYYAAHKDELKARAIACRVAITHKRCCACDQVLPVSRFQRTQRTRDGYQTWCKSCRKAYDAERKEAKAAYDRADRAANLERHREWGRLWRARNGEHIRRQRRLNAAANSARVKRYYWANPEPFKVRANERRVRLRRIPGRFTAADILLIREVQRGLCAYCRSPLSANSPIEHMTPITRDGTNWPWNLCVACVPCNQRKFTKTAGEYLALLLREGRAQAAV